MNRSAAAPTATRALNDEQVLASALAACGLLAAGLMFIACVYGQTELPGRRSVVPDVADQT